MKITLPLPPVCLQPNRNRGHWANRSRSAKNARAEAKLVTYLADDRRGQWRKPELRVTFYFATSRKRDDDNLIGWLKAYRDGIADGLGVNDYDMYTQRPAQAIDRKDPRVEIEVIETQPVP